MYDIIVVGGGPAGMTAALYALRNGKTALVIEKEGFGGQITHSPRVENYPGFLSASGNEIADAVFEQIMAQGAEIEIATVVEVRLDEGHKTVLTDDGGSFEGKAVILAPGVKHRMLGLPGEDELVGEGISFCAVCDGDFYAGKRVCMVGGGNSALQEAILLSEKCSHVTLLQDLPVFTGEPPLQKILFGRDNVTGICSVKVTELLTNEDGSFRGVAICNQDGSDPRYIACDGLFVAIGLIPENDAFAQLVPLDEWGYFDVDENCCASEPGIFVAGDCRAKRVRQVATAIADGATAAIAACRYVNGV